MPAINVSNVLARAASMIGKGTKYKLGRGGTNPAAATPADAAGRCDCSGFICWCLGMSRKTTHPAYLKFNGGWINTNAIVFDANSAVGFFTRLSAPVAGALWVYPWKKATKRVGHVAIIDSVSKSGTSIIHCSAGNYRGSGDAIRRTSGALFEKNRDSIIAWFAGFDAAMSPSNELHEALFEA